MVTKDVAVPKEAEIDTIVPFNSDAVAINVTGS